MNLRNLLVVVGLFVCFSNVNASGLDEHESECYSVSMVGYDSVINSNLGVPLDEVINTFVTNNDAPSLPIFQDYLLLVVMDAYQWDGTPHMYAVKTMYQCASRHAEVAMH
ncbi:MAG: hypothetical protein R3240_01135 [Gammaproteobacteria bacterium]|nr:hypothetical protein [Gammaproteobacteria bacterium]